MQMRKLGRTGVEVSVLGFGCGAVGGMMVKGDPKDQERAFARALEAGITFFDTAPSYGNGASETNVGRVLKTLKPDLFLANKFTIRPEDKDDVAGAVERSLDASLKRLQRDSVDLLQLHNRIAASGDDRPLDARQVIEQVAPALDRLKQKGKIRFGGITALGDTDLLHRVVKAQVFDTAQICFNLLNPSAALPVPPGLPAQDFAELALRAKDAGMGRIGIRVFAGGALSGSEARHPNGVPSVPPIASGPDYATDVSNAHRFDALIKEGHASSLIEAALRFAISGEALSTVLAGTATLDQLETAIAAVGKGPLPPAALALAAQ
ncbi:MAG: aldo/keto reductase [Alphaproteobacteria bacterium]|nr:aldo/keto reductase [Alphaproteobacteria bacterium]